jgi:hypothetical protein
MDYFSIRGENLFQHILGNIGIKATNKNLRSATKIDINNIATKMAVTQENRTENARLYC